MDKTKKIRKIINIIWALVFLIIIAIRVFTTAVQIREKIFYEIQADEMSAYLAADYYRVYDYEYDEAKKLLDGHSWSEVDVSLNPVYGAAALIDSNGTRYSYENPYVVACRLYEDMLYYNNSYGFYGNVIDAEGKVLVESQDMIIVERDNTLLKDSVRTEDYLDSSKVIVLDGVFSDSDIKKIHKYAGTDNIGNNFIALGTFDNACIYLSEIKFTQSSRVKTEFNAESIVDKGTDVSTWIIAGNASLGPVVVQNSYCNDAKKILQDNIIYSNVFENGRYSQKNTNIFTSYYYGSWVTDDKYAANYSFVFHPVFLAINTLKIEIICTLVLFVVAIVVTNSIIKKIINVSSR